MKKVLQRLHKLKIAVGVLSPGEWREEFAVSLTNMCTAFLAHKVENFREQSLHTISVKGSILPRMRLSVLKQAKELQADYLLFVDSDQSFPRWTLHHLIMRDKDVIGANIATKTFPTLPTARRWKAGEPAGELVYTDLGMKDLEKVWRIGTGLLLMKRRVFEKLPHSCFSMPYLEEADTYQGEDWTLCEAIERLGFDIWVDHHLSQEIGHHGAFNFTHEYNGHVSREELPAYGLESKWQENQVDVAGRGSRSNGILSEDVY